MEDGETWISQMTLITAYHEVTISPMDTGEHEPHAAEIRRLHCPGRGVLLAAGRQVIGGELRRSWAKVVQQSENALETARLF
jgi:hypothetical protein